MIKRSLWVVFFLTMTSSYLFSQSIKDKKHAINTTPHLQTEKETSLQKALSKEKSLLEELYEKVEELSTSPSSEEEIKKLLPKIKQTRANLIKLQEEWRKHQKQSFDKEAAFINAESMTLKNFLFEYGSQDVIYLIPDEVMNMPIRISSRIPIPQESWDEILEILLSENGMGIRKIHPFLAKIYLSDQALESISGIYSDWESIKNLSSYERIAFYFETTQHDQDNLLSILDKFATPNKASYHELEHGILLFSTVEEVTKVGHVFRFLDKDATGYHFKLLHTQRIPPETVKSILTSYFASISSGFSCELVDHVASTLFITGSQKEIETAEMILQSMIEHDPTNNSHSTYCYRAKHSDVKDLAKVLANAYPTLRQTKRETKEGESLKGNLQNFIVDEKTDTIIMIVHPGVLPSLLDLIKKIDIPKKMVQLEVLFFEKKTRETNNFGLNLMRIGSHAAQAGNIGGASWNLMGGLTSEKAELGIFEFFLSRKKHKGIPAYDITYQFLISQEDIQVNSNPTVTTINQTPAIVKLVDEISINTGVVAFGNNTQDTFLKDSFSREEFGISLEITPIINLGGLSKDIDGKSYVTVKTNVKFDTNNSRASNPRPDITRREIKNEVRVKDGETIILGGLKRKTSKSAQDTLPFFGSIPGVGKLFRNNEEGQDSQEMFICITPKIIDSPEESSYKNKLNQLKRRPGQTPEWYKAVTESKIHEASTALEETLFSFHVTPESDSEEDCEYDGTY